MRTFRTSIAGLALFVLAAFAANDARAQISMGVHGGYNLDAFTDEGAESGAFLAGGEVRFGVSEFPIVIRSGVTFFFDGIDDATAFQANADVLYEVGVDNAVFTPYFGVGLAVTHASLSADFPIVGEVFSAEETDVGASVIGGAAFGMGAVRPFAQARITLGNHLVFVNDDGDGGPGYELAAGLLFRLGQ